jgi:tight adherence protein C
MGPAPLLALLAAATAALIVGGAMTLLPARAAPAPGVAAVPNPIVALLGRLARPSEGVEQADINSQLTQAGLPGRRAADAYLALRTCLAIATPILAWVSWHPASTNLRGAAVVLGIGVGYYLPYIVVEQRRGARQKLLRRAFPNFLDLLVSSLEAGLGLDIALRRVANELQIAAPLLSHEISLVNAEMTAGISRVEALQHLHRRTGLPEIASLVQELAQSERFGSRIAQALRTHARAARVQQLLQSERRAAEATPKLTVVMILFILPPLFIVVLGPTAIKLLDRAPLLVSP